MIKCDNCGSTDFQKQGAFLVCTHCGNATQIEAEQPQYFQNTVPVYSQPAPVTHTPQPKKHHWIRNTFIVILILAVIFIGLIIYFQANPSAETANANFATNFTLESRERVTQGSILNSYNQTMYCQVNVMNSGNEAQYNIKVIVTVYASASVIDSDSFTISVLEQGESQLVKFEFNVYQYSRLDAKYEVVKA